MGAQLNIYNIHLLTMACGKQNSRLLLNNGGGSNYNCLSDFSVGIGKTAFFPNLGQNCAQVSVLRLC